ncbi:MAG: YlxR family protein [Chloroflexota bacterium]|nr:YlxR family protein [Chloroflexota bacterium]
MPTQAKTPGRVRKQPQRTCVACREVAGKRGLLRMVRTPEQVVELDPTGKKNGRGAYVHASTECARKALGTGSLSRALKAPVEPGVAEQLLAKVTDEEARSADS